jgi:hypothetical protein
MNTTQKPDALRLADWLDDQTVPDHYKGFAATELRRLYARVTELEQRLEIDPRHRYDGISARDAARYRYLRDVYWGDDKEFMDMIVMQMNKIWDEKIDAAIATQASKKVKST